MSHSRGDVVWADAPFSESPSRPWLLVSNDVHPFDAEEVVCQMITTTPRDVAIEITDEAVVDGGFPTQSFINPWVPVTMKRASLDERQAELEQNLVDEAIGALVEYLE